MRHSYCNLILLASLLALATTLQSLAQTPREVAEKAMPSVVLLVMEDADGQPVSLGSGFVTADGVVATNYHVIENAARGYARIVGQKERLEIEGIVGIDAKADLALLAVDGLRARALSNAESSSVKVGDDVYVVGNPQGLEGTFSAGIASGIRRINDDYLIQITAPISPGSSGGPVLNAKGEVIGIAVATFRGGQNLNFAIPSSYLSKLITERGMARPLAEEEPKNKRTSILEGLGDKPREGVIGADLTWALVHNQSGEYSFSIRNVLRDNVAKVRFLIVFYNSDGAPIDSREGVYRGVIRGGTAARVTGRVHGSVQEITTRRGSKTPHTKTEIRILDFEFADGNQRSDASPRQPQEERHVEAADVPTLEQGDDALANTEKELAKLVAKIAPAGDGPDLIESRIAGEFTGWNGDTVFVLDNGQVWQQVTYSYTFTFAFRPKVWIIKTHGAYRMVVEGVSESTFVKRLKEDDFDIFDRRGNAVAYIEPADDLTIYLWSGRPVAYLKGKSVYGFNGRHIGWFEGGTMYDRRGAIVGATSQHLAVPAKPAIPKGSRHTKPVKRVQRLAPLQPLFRITWSDIPTEDFLLQGTK